MEIERIRAYKLTSTHHKRFLTVKKGYDAYVEYWNSRI